MLAENSRRATTAGNKKTMTDELSVQHPRPSFDPPAIVGEDGSAAGATAAAQPRSRQHHRRNTDFSQCSQDLKRFLSEREAGKRRDSDEMVPSPTYK